MNQACTFIFKIAFAVTVVGMAIAGPPQSPTVTETVDDETEQQRNGNSFRLPSNVHEARARAKILHELIHGTLQVVHRDFFEEENPLAIPSASMEDVFVEMSRAFGVEIKWLNAGTDVVNVDHEPADEFERSAADRIRKGEPFVDAFNGDQYQYTGSIRLPSQCLKCHVKRRNSNHDRFAGLLISMPVRVHPKSSAK
ncbi:DUF3365 domain-containing protein [Rubripirellula sp.]|nr:DUF3365 domain-containing protein [Rubripirellula sp.]